MIRRLSVAMAVACASAALNPALAQEGAAQMVTGTRLDVVATGEVTRVPDVARINAGVVTQASTATEAIRLNAQQMSKVVAAPPTSCR